jgi:hypothetical protein
MDKLQVGWVVASTLGKRNLMVNGYCFSRQSPAGERANKSLTFSNAPKLKWGYFSFGSIPKLL